MNYINKKFGVETMKAESVKSRYPEIKTYIDENYSEMTNPKLIKEYPTIPLILKAIKQMVEGLFDSNESLVNS